MKKILSLLIVTVLALSLLTACSTAAPAASETPAATPEVSEAATPAATEAATPEATEAPELKTIKVGASPTPHAEILNAIKPLLAEQGYDLEVVEFTDYVQPNLALEDDSLDANYFQHAPYLDEFNKENKTNIVSLAAIHFEPLGIYPGKTASLDALADGAKVAVPNDTTNEARALLLLEAQGLIKLKADAGLNATVKDIAENPKKLDIVELEAAQLPRTLADVDIAVINGNYAIEAGLNAAADALAKEDPTSLAATTFANILAVRAGDEGREDLKALAAALTSDTARKFIEDTYAGAVVPVF
jgi:D-methionine transport system substrate-binding protein